MAIYIGNNTLSAAKLGTTNISSIWLGDVKLWPTIVYYKFQAEYSDGTSYNVECNQSTTLSSAETKGNTASFYDMSACTIGDCVTVIGAEALSETEITSIDIPSSVTEIGQGALSLTHLTALTIPSSVITVGQGAAEWNNDLSTLNLNEGLITIGNSAFRWNKKLSSVTIPSTVTSIGNEAFWEDSGLTDVTVYAVNPPTLGTDVFSTNVGGVHVPISCTIHVPCESLDTYKAATNWSTYANQMQPIQGTCPKLLAKYSNGTTYKVDCDGSGTLTTGNTHPSGYKASAMTEAIIGDCVTIIPNGLTSAKGLFTGCTNLSSVTIGNNVTKIGNYAFQYCSGLTNINIPSSVTTIGSFVFAYCNGLTSINIPSSVTTIGESTFRQCVNLTNCILSDSISIIERHTFNKCSALTSVNIPESTTLINYDAFRDCVSLSSITIPNSVVNIGEYAFLNTKLSSLTIPSSVTSIGNYAFSGCKSLTSITVEATTPPSLGTNVFNSTNNCPIYVPCQSLDTYKAATNWSTYASRIQPIPNSCVSCNWEIMSEGDEIPSNYVKGIRIPFGAMAPEGTYIGFEDEDGNIIEVAYDMNDDSWFMQYPSGSEQLVFVGDYAEVNFSDYGVGDATVTNSSIPFECILCIVP